MVTSWKSRLSVLLVSVVAASCGQPYEPEGNKVDTVEQGLSVCQGPNVLPGIDVSSYQGNINWGQVAGSGIKFAYTKATENLGYQDPYFSANWSGMKANGIARGAYHFFHPNVSGTQQADYYLAYVGTLGPGDLPPMLDWEVSSGASAATAAANATDFINEIRAKTGRETIIYTSPGIWSGFGIGAGFGNNPLWVAHYLFCTGGSCCPTMPTGWSSWVAWQWADNGSVPGISGHVDMDLFNGTLSDLTNLGGGPVCTNPIGHALGAGGPVSGACGGSAPAVTAPTGCGALQSGTGLSKGQSVTSCDGRFSFVMQGDGNLVEYSNGIAMWNAGSQPNGDVAVMQGDGNLVIYDSGGCPVWASKTDGNAGASLAVQDDGNLVVYAGSTAKWSSGSGPMGAKPASCGTMNAGEALAPGATLDACGGCFSLIMQADGNLVVYKKGGGALWSSATANTDGYTTEVQSDGNVVLYSRAGCALWSSGSDGHNGAHLAMQDDGNLVVYDSGGTALWNSQTVSCAGGCTCNQMTGTGGGGGGTSATGGGSGSGGGAQGATGGGSGAGGGVSGTGGGSGAGGGTSAATGGGVGGAGGGAGSAGGGGAAGGGSMSSGGGDGELGAGGGSGGGGATPVPPVKPVVPEQKGIKGTVGCSSTGGLGAFALVALVAIRRRRRAF